MQEFCCSLISASLASPTGPPEKRSSLGNGMPATAQKGRERKLWSQTFFLSPRRLLRTASPIWSWPGARPTDPQASTCAEVSSALQPDRHRGQGGQSASFASPPPLCFVPTLPTPSSPGPGEIPALTPLAAARPGRKRAPRPELRLRTEGEWVRRAPAPRSRGREFPWKRSGGAGRGEG